MQNPICRKCKCAPSSVVDHNIAAKYYCHGDSKRFYDRANLIAMCKECHDAKTEWEDINGNIGIQ